MISRRSILRFFGLLPVAQVIASHSLGADRCDWFDDLPAFPPGLRTFDYPTVGVPAELSWPPVPSAVEYSVYIHVNALDPQSIVSMIERDNHILKGIGTITVREP